MTNVQLHCETCGARAKRPLLEQVSCRGTHETASEPAHCPNGHGEMIRDDGVIVETDDHGVRTVTGRVRAL